MPRKFTLQLLASLMLVSTTSTASACCLPPVLNPFVWLFGCGSGCNTGCGYGYGYAPQCGLAPLFCGTGCGYGYGECGPVYGAAAATGYNTMGTSTIYSPSWPTATGNCGCETAGTMPHQQAYASPPAQATAWAPAPSYGYNYNPPIAQHRIPMPAAAWSPAQAWTPAPGWSAPQQSAWMPAPAPRSAALPTAPMYGPAWEVPPSAPRTFNSASGDITGDHEAYHAPSYPLPVTPATYRRYAPNTQVHPVSYGVRPRPARQYRQAVR